MFVSVNFANIFTILDHTTQ